MAAQRTKNPMHKRFIVLLDGVSLFDQELAKLVTRSAAELIFETLATLEVKNISTLSTALGISRDRLVGIMDDLEIRHIFDSIKRRGPKRSPPKVDHGSNTYPAKK